MRIGLIDIDSHRYPNLALMKLSAYHKAQGNEVEWYTPFERYNLVYKSKVFTVCDDIRQGQLRPQVHRPATMVQQPLHLRQMPSLRGLQQDTRNNRQTTITIILNQ
jgi:hypothetical protein